MPSFSRLLFIPEYILPPIECIPKKIEEITGITDQFLRQGGYDTSLGKEVGKAREFREVYLDFQDFCNTRSKGKQLVFVAHNAKFDLRMINGELRRWRLGGKETAPTLGNTFTCSVDTLHLFREKKWWRSLARPSSFSLSTLHSHLFGGESFTNIHNAVGDIKGLERLLLADQFEGWKNTANKIQIPFIKVDK